MTILNIINKVQRALRLPQSTDVTDTHGAMLLDYANDVQRIFMAKKVQWDALKDFTHFHTVDGTATYTLAASGASYEIDTIDDLKIGNYPSLVKLSDNDFRASKKIYTEEGQPLFYRIYQRTIVTVATIKIELLPVPAAAYQVDQEVHIKPLVMTAKGDVPMLDADTIFLGVKWLAVHGQGENWQKELGESLAALSDTASVEADGNFGDVEAV